MRISGDGYLADMQRSLTTAETALRRLSQQISSGRRLTRPSDDPLAVGQVIGARSDLAAVLNRQDALARGIMLTGSADAALEMPLLRATTSSAADSRARSPAPTAPGACPTPATRAASSCGSRRRGRWR